MEALVEAREQKVVRFLGLTGHHRDESLMEGIRRFPFDAVLLAVNAADAHHFSFKEKLLPLALEKQMGIIAMKVTSRSRILSSWTPPAARAAEAHVGVGRRGRDRERPGCHRHARGDVLHAVAAREHGDRRLRLARRSSRRT